MHHILLTHLDFDHAGGLDDFPQATVHLLAAEVEAATARPTVLDRMRYRPQQWSSLDRWIAYEPGGESWLGFDCVRELDGLPPDILLVPLIGHTFGHAGVAVRRDRDWLLLAGDAYFFHAELRRSRGDEVQIACSHDMVEFERLAGRSAALPARALASGTGAPDWVVPGFG